MVKFGIFNNQYISKQKDIYIYMQQKESLFTIYSLNNSRFSSYDKKHLEDKLSYISEHEILFNEKSTNILWRVYKSLITNFYNKGRAGVRGNVLYTIINIWQDDFCRPILQKFREKYKFTKDEEILQMLKDLNNII